MIRPTIFASAAALLVGSFLVVACGADADPARSEDIQALTGDAANGSVVFGANCASCHGADAKSGSAGKDLTASSEKVVVDTVLAGTIGMPSFESLEDQEIADLVAHLAGL